MPIDRETFMPPEIQEKKEKVTVVFIAHALLPDSECLSTQLITERLNELGKKWPKENENPEVIKWFSFVISGVRVDFYIIPVFGGEFLEAVHNKKAFKWCDDIATQAIKEGEKASERLVVGWGALTKNATGHGEEFFNRHPEFSNNPDIRTTHGDAGSVALILEAMRMSEINENHRIAVIGANGVIGDTLLRAIPLEFKPESLLLVGRGGRNLEEKNKNLERLKKLEKRILEQNVGADTKIEISQDKETACFDHGSDVVIVATQGMQLLPKELPPRVLVLDTTAPPACVPCWWGENRLILSAGCGQFSDKSGFPGNFYTDHDGKEITDVGAGGDRVLWGCLMETIARAIEKKSGHLCGPNIPLEEIKWCKEVFAKLGIVPQDPSMFGRPIPGGWTTVAEFMKKQRA